MRDGVKLHTNIIFPKDMVDGKATAIMDRSPYGGDALELINDIYIPFGFITIGQDMRGTGLSEGNFTIWHSDADDSEDLADGLAAFRVPENQPSWLEAQYFIWSSSIAYDVIFPNGAYLQALADMWIRSTVREGEAEGCLQTIAENEAKTDWWTPLDLTNKYDKIKGSSGFWSGWYDIFLVGNLAAYEGYNTQSDEKVRYTSRLTIDPLGHCQGGAEYFKGDLIAGRTALAVAQSLETFGVRPVTRTDIKNVTFYVMSSNDEAGLSAGQYWTSLEKFPTPTFSKYYLHPDGTSSTSKPTSGAAYSSYKHDPTNPVPTQGGNNLQLPCGPLDQSEVDKRADVLTFQTEAQTSEVVMTGPLFATLFVSSDAVDTDFNVRISDVYPTGEVRLIQDNAARMRWREGGLSPVWMEKGAVYETTLSLWNTSYIIAPGHALRFSVSSSNYPRFDINRNNGILLADVTPGDANITATNSVYHSAQYASYVSLPIVKKIQLPKSHDIKGQVQKAYPTLDIDRISKEYPEMLYDLVNPSRKQQTTSRN
eukprot:gene23949-30233_t